MTFSKISGNLFTGKQVISLVLFLRLTGLNLFSVPWFFLVDELLRFDPEGVKV